MASSSRWASSNGRFVGSAKRPAAEVRATCRRSQRVGARGLSRGLQRPPNGAPRRRTGGRFRAPAPARARAAVAAVQVADFPRRPVCSARSRPCPLLCGYGDAGASLVGWRFVVVGPDLTITGPEQLVSPWVVLARSGLPQVPRIDGIRSRASAGGGANHSTTLAPALPLLHALLHFGLRIRKRPPRISPKRPLTCCVSQSG